MSEYTPTTEEIREYIEAADRATAHMVALDAPDTVEAFDRWLAARDSQVRVEALRDAAALLRKRSRDASEGPDRTVDPPSNVPWATDLGYYGEAAWLDALADRIDDTNQQDRSTTDE